MNGIEIVSSWLSPTVLFCILNLMIGTIFITSLNRKQPKTGDEQLPQLFRAPSLLVRVKSINLSRYRSEPQPDPVRTIVDPKPQHQEVRNIDGEETSHVTRSKSDTGVGEVTAVPAARLLKKSASEKIDFPAAEEKAATVDRRRPATVRERAAEEDEAVDEKADDFINRFRQQLKLQRLDSILRYKEMLNRGTGR